MNLHALRLFHVIASTGSVTRASEVLNISQPAITSQIKKFEHELSLTLLRPQGRGIALTCAGESIAALAKRLFGIEQQIEQFVLDFSQGLNGRVQIAATYLPAHYLLPTWIAKFKQAYESVEMNITTTNSSEAFNKLLLGEVDFAIYGGLAESHPDAISTEQLFKDELWFVVAPDHQYANKTVTLFEMMQVPFVMREEGSSTRARLLALCRTYHVPAPRIALQFNGLNEAIQSVVSGYGQILSRRSSSRNGYNAVNYVAYLWRIAASKIRSLFVPAIMNPCPPPLKTSSRRFVNTLFSSNNLYNEVRVSLGYPYRS